MRKRCLTIVLFILTVTPVFAASYPRLRYRHQRLASGLEVYSVEDHSMPLVAIEVWYRVGSRDDPPQRGGFSHLFEHMMFKSTAHLTDEMFKGLVQDAGGTSNAETWEDLTRYHEVVPSNYLQTMLWAEAERMTSLRVDRAAFETEREVVKDEFRMRVLADPYGRFDVLLDSRSFTVHPYRRPIIGSIEELDAATLEEVQEFHRTYYRPDNAILVVAGDFTPRELDRYVDQYFGRIPRPATPIVRKRQQEPPRTEDKSFLERAPNVTLPAVAMSWLLPATRQCDCAPLEVAWGILDGGTAAWLSTDLAYGEAIAHDPEALLDYRDEHTLFAVRMKLASGREPEDGLAAIRAEISKLAEDSTAGDVEQAKRQIINSRLHDRETVEGKAEAIAWSVFFMNDPGDADAELRRLEAVTLADVQRAVKRHLVDGKTVSITYLPEAAR